VPVCFWFVHPEKSRQYAVDVDQRSYIAPGCYAEVKGAVTKASFLYE
jgi:hypothetical protein